MKKIITVLLLSYSYVNAQTITGGAGVTLFSGNLNSISSLTTSNTDNSKIATDGAGNFHFYNSSLTSGSRWVNLFNAGTGGKLGLGITSSPRAMIDLNGLDGAMRFGVVGSSQSGYIGLSQKLNFGNVLFAKNLYVPDGQANDSYRYMWSTGSTAASTDGFSGIELGYGGKIRFLTGSVQTIQDSSITNTSMLANYNPMTIVGGKVVIGDNVGNTEQGSSYSQKLTIMGTSGQTLRIVDGNQGVGRVLISNASGVASWTNASGVPSGGTTGQVLTKNTASDYDYGWATPTSGVADGDKGDISVTNSGATWTIDDNVVGLAKIQQINTGRLLGRSTASTGNVEQISIGNGLTLASNTLSLTSSAIPLLTYTQSFGLTTISQVGDIGLLPLLFEVGKTYKLIGKYFNSCQLKGTGTIQNLNIGDTFTATGTSLYPVYIEVTSTNLSSCTNPCLNRSYTLIFQQMN